MVLIGVIAVSFAAIFIRMAEAPALAIAFYRMGLSAIMLFPVMLIYRDRLRNLETRVIFLSLGAGFFLALHFAFWVQAFTYTSVSSAVVFLSTQPLFVTGLGLIFLGERINKWFVVGLFLAVGGGLIIGWGDLTMGEPEAIRGNLLALMGAIFAAFYFVLGSRVRATLGLLPYIFMAYSTAALFLLGFCLLWRVPLTGYTGSTYGYFFLLALIPTIIGHSSLNWSLKYLPASFVALSILGEPVGATIFAFFLLGEVPHLLTWLGGAVILVGIYLALGGIKRNKKGMEFN